MTSTWKGKLTTDIEFRADQHSVLDEYFNGSGRVAVSAGAGTGKTTLLVEIIAESVLRLLEADPNHNPFDKILAVTFTVEAARQMKARVKQRLNKHFNSTTDKVLLNNISRWLENESWILTLDSLTRNLISEIAPDIGTNIISVIPDEYQIGKVKKEIFEELKASSAYLKDLELIESFSPFKSWTSDEELSRLLSDLFQKSRMYGLSVEEFKTNAINSFENDLYLKLKPPFSSSDIKKIYANVRPDTPPKTNSKYVDKSYEHNKRVMDSLMRVLTLYESHYDEKSMKNGWLSHDDARYWLIRYAEGKISSTNYRDEWLDTQKNRFKHILIDEFQDTSFAQCSLLRNFIGDKTNVFLIGDPKQAIYEWRGAEPDIFVDIINEISKNGPKKKIPFLNADAFKNYDLTSNYRSVECLIDMFNDIFGDNPDSIFKNVFYTGDRQIPHCNLVAETTLPSKKDPNQSHIHSYNTDCNSFIPKILSEIQSGSSDIYVRDKDEKGKPKWRKAKLGDCCILMQTRTRWPKLRPELIDNKINYVMLAEKGLFGRPEISIIIDILDWFANPHNKDSFIRILRSPIVGLSDRALRYLAYHNFSLYSVEKDTSKPTWFKTEASPLLNGLVKLKDDLRWLREGKKTTMIAEVLKYSHLDTILLTRTEGDQHFGNILALMDIISTWEDEELLSYNELLERLKYYRESAPDAYNMAVLADESDQDSVKIATVHATKGLEFPIVFVYYPQLDFRKQRNFVINFINKDPSFVKNQGNTIVFEQLKPEIKGHYEWEEFFCLDDLQTVCSGSKSCFYDSFQIEYFNEKWRLYYVALTRAKDHIFHTSVPIKSKCSESYSWQDVFLKWYSANLSNKCLSTYILSPSKAKTKPFLTPPSFDLSKYGVLKDNNSYYIPRVINPSHLYDLIFCPRRYQYAVLQQVSGGNTCTHDHDIEAAQLGTKIHRALELRDFSSAKENKEYIDYLSSIDEKTMVRSAVNDFLTSKFFKTYKLDKARTSKEIEILFTLPDSTASNMVLMKDQIDLLVETKDGIAIVDYKSVYPLGKTPWDVYMQKHYDYQLKSYALAVEKGLELKVSEALILYHDKKKKLWSTREVAFDNNNFEKEIQNHLKIKVVDGGLEKRTKPNFCKREFCEFFDVCNY